MAATRTNIEMDLVKLSDGGRLLRLFDRGTGMALERKVDSKKPVVRQKQQLLVVFEAALERANGSAV
jgi:hypothetical protein